MIIANTPKPPYYAVISTSLRTNREKEEYGYSISQNGWPKICPDFWVLNLYVIKSGSVLHLFIGKIKHLLKPGGIILNIKKSKNGDGQYGKKIYCSNRKSRNRLWQNLIYPFWRGVLMAPD